jgi:hypothetical protein
VGLLGFGVGAIVIRSVRSCDAVREHDNSCILDWKARLAIGVIRDTLPASLPDRRLHSPGMEWVVTIFGCSPDHSSTASPAACSVPTSDTRPSIPGLNSGPVLSVLNCRIWGLPDSTPISRNPNSQKISLAVRFVGSCDKGHDGKLGYINAGYTSYTQS